MTRTSFILLALIASTLAAPTVARSENSAVVCVLERSGVDFKGSCDIPCWVNELAVTIDGATARQASCDARPRRVATVLRKSEKGDGWIGTMEGRQVEDPTRFEVIDGRASVPEVAKTPFGWFALQSARQEGDALRLTISAERQLPPTADDIRIIQRAKQLVSGAETWNRNDDRVCRPNPQQWSVFCALMQATEEVSGGIHYRQPALQAVRDVLNEVGGTRVGKHRLMDYNNHADTTLEDIHNLLLTAQARVESRLR